MAPRGAFLLHTLDTLDFWVEGSTSNLRFATLPRVSQASVEARTLHLSALCYLLNSGCVVLGGVLPNHCFPPLGLFHPPVCSAIV